MLTPMTARTDLIAAVASTQPFPRIPRKGPLRNGLQLALPNVPVVVMDTLHPWRIFRW
jgi:hypothetical protein